jgi:hypothetical protein
MAGLLEAAGKGDLSRVQRLVAEGADVKRENALGWTALLRAAFAGHLDTVRWLLFSGGSSILEMDGNGNNSLLLSAFNGHVETCEWLLAEGGAAISAVNRRGDTVWSELRLDRAGTGALSSLLKTMVLLSDAPADFIARLSPENAKLAARGHQLRAQLPTYLEHQRAAVITHCVLPAVLQPIISSYAAPTPEDMWTHGLRV